MEVVNNHEIILTIEICFIIKYPPELCVAN